MNTMNNYKTNVIHAVIEISAHSSPVKYELDEKGLLWVDRFLNVSMTYPCNYGVIPGTLSPDGDSADVLVITPYPLVPGCHIQCKVIGALSMVDQGQQDDKFIAVPIDDLSEDILDIQLSQRNAIKHFFQHYKDLDSKGNNVQVGDYINKTDAIEMLRQSEIKFLSQDNN